jgi:hypothetical protein
MKKVIASMLILFMGIIVCAQDLQQATTTRSVRLFSDKDDLTTVIQLIPEGSTVEVIKTDSLYSQVRFGEVTGYVKSDGLAPSEPVVSATPVAQPQAVEQQQYEAQPEDRYAALVAKYGTDIGKRLYQNKVWKGVTSEMAIDSWGKPKQINRMYVDQSVDEEWIYSKKWLYFRDGILIEWGAVKQ